MGKQRTPISFLIHDAMKQIGDPDEIAVSVIDAIDPADRDEYLADLIRQRVTLIRGYRRGRAA